MPLLLREPASQEGWKSRAQGFSFGKRMVRDSHDVEEAAQRGIPYLNDWHAHKGEQALALIIVLPRHPHSALAVLLHLLCRTSLRHTIFIGNSSYSSATQDIHQ